MRRSIRLAVAAVAASAALVLGGCSSGGSDAKDSSSTIPVDADAAVYCKQLAALPASLSGPAGHVAAGGASSADKQRLSSAIKTLRSVSKNAKAPKDLRAKSGSAASVLDKVLNSRHLSDDDIKQLDELNSLGTEVKDAC